MKNFCEIFISKSVAFKNDVLNKFLISLKGVCNAWADPLIEFIVHNNHIFVLNFVKNWQRKSSRLSAILVVVENWVVIKIVFYFCFLCKFANWKEFIWQIDFSCELLYTLIFCGDINLIQNILQIFHLFLYLIKLLF